VINLSDKNIQYILLSSNKIDDMISILWAKEYNVVSIDGYYRGQYEKAALAFSDISNDELRKDLIFLLNHFGQECGIIKYSGETGAKKIFNDGSEKPLGIVLYNTDSDNMSYLHNGLSFSFVEQVRYWKPNKKEDFKIGMLVEYFNNNKWYSKKVENPNDEWEKMFKLLTKYEKVRVAFN
jgi:hypothetical protein